MKTTLKAALVLTSLVLMLLVDIPVLPGKLVPDAEAIFGVRRRTARRTAVIVGSAVHAEDEAQIAAAQQQAAAAQQQAAAAQKQAAAATAPPPPAAAGKPLPLGTVVAALPSGCTPTPVGGQEYYYCSGNFYRAVFQGNSLVYVTAQPK